MVSQQLSFKLGKNVQVPCITFGWLVFYLFATSIIFGMLGANMGGTNAETGEVTKRNWQAVLAAIINTIVFALFLIGLILGCRCRTT